MDGRTLVSLGRRDDHAIPQLCLKYCGSRTTVILLSEQRKSGYGGIRVKNPVHGKCTPISTVKNRQNEEIGHETLCAYSPAMSDDAEFLSARQRHRKQTKRTFQMGCPTGNIFVNISGSKGVRGSR